MVSIEAINGAAKEGGPFVVMTEDRAYGFATIEECEGRAEAFKDSFAVLRFLWAGGETFGSLKAHLKGPFDTSYAKAADKALAAITLTHELLYDLQAGALTCLVLSDIFRKKMPCAPSTRIYKSEEGEKSHGRIPSQVQ